MAGEAEQLSSVAWLSDFLPWLPGADALRSSQREGTYIVEEI